VSEIDQRWHKSSFSGPDGCVSVRWDGARIQVRDDKDPQGSVLVFDRREWAAFLAGVHNDEFDLPDVTGR
jgi:hypothetical protein